MKTSRVNEGRKTREVTKKKSKSFFCPNLQGLQVLVLKGKKNRGETRVVVHDSISLLLYASLNDSISYYFYALVFSFCHEIK